VISNGIWPSVSIFVGNATLVAREYVYVYPPPPKHRGVLARGRPLTEAAAACPYAALQPPLGTLCTGT
jgi:hypothetical protein